MDTRQSSRLGHRTRGLVAAFAAPTVAETVRLLTRAGVPVFPCVPLTKRPATEHGFHDATTDPVELARWWRSWPEANVAIPTGASSGWDVVDVDVHDDESIGRAAFAQAVQRGLSARWALQVRTPSGGLHAWFPNVTRQSCWQVPGRHVDFRTDGGYVVVPPSRVTYEDGSSGRYEVIEVANQIPGPVDGRALRAFLDPRDDVAAFPRTAPLGVRRGADPVRLADWVASRPKGGRNAGLFWAACRLAEHGHDFGTALSTIGNAALHAGLGARETEATIRSAFRRATRAAHPAPDRAGSPHPSGGGRRLDPPEVAIS
ncbi:bifunctional DNA primase/polymerase [Antribacter gilvus]|uniref:bifunctional DNA primase/polymerase n=1 Tax=Antribacter gilvus TaxID=2304675 RepID=UPI000F798E77|nr:bifunctional DNA primase/polymerase [Antribacter gilvus]